MKKTLLLIALVLVSVSAFGDITRLWFPLPAANNQFLVRHRRYARLLWAFDYGHALIYEQLWRNAQTGDYDFSVVEGDIFRRVSEILVNPPAQAPTEDTLSPFFTMEFSRVMNLFTWAHKLHWVAFDVIATEPPDRAKVIMREQLAAYQRLAHLALPTKCKSMMYFMEGQPFSMRFRRAAPKANGVIWAYHYYQLAIYDALMVSPGPAREEELRKVFRNFHRMAEDPVNNVPEMPMAKKVSPKFYKEYPELAAIFDNLHEVHDVVGDLLSVDDNTYGSPARKRIEMDRMVNEALDDVTQIIDCDKNGHTDDQPRP